MPKCATLVDVLRIEALLSPPTSEGELSTYEPNANLPWRHEKSVYGFSTDVIVDHSIRVTRKVVLSGHTPVSAPINPSTAHLFYRNAPNQPQSNLSRIFYPDCFKQLEH